MNSVMEISGDTIASEVFNAYYNNKVDYDLSKAWQMNLAFSDKTMAKIVPEIAQDRYSELITAHLNETRSPSALMDKYTWSIYDSNGTATQLFKIDENNSYLDDLIKQTDSGLNSTINKYGCNFMATIAFPQLLTGNILDASEIQSIWDYSKGQQSYSLKYNSIMSWIIDESEVLQPDKIANELLNNMKYGNLKLQFGIYGNMSDKKFVGYKNKVPYSYSGHWVLGNNKMKSLYNSANSIGNVLDRNSVYVYEK